MILTGLGLAKNLTQRKTMADALWMRLREVDWVSYGSAGNNSARMPKLLQDLASRKASRGMRAAHEVWKLVCSGGVREVAQPTLPFLLEIATMVQPEVAMEVYDIVVSCAVAVAQSDEGWEAELREDLVKAESSLVRRLARSKGDLAIVLERLVGQLRELST